MDTRFREAVRIIVEYKKIVSWVENCIRNSISSMREKTISCVVIATIYCCIVFGQEAGGNIGIERAVVVDFKTEIGRWYQVEYSGDMETWIPDGEQFPGTGGLVSRFFRDGADRRFYRSVDIGRQVGARRPLDELEPNDQRLAAQPLDAIGYLNPLFGRIDVGDDVDWYQFEAESGVDYLFVLEMVHANLSSRSGNARVAGLGSYSGLAISVHDSFGTLLGRTRPSGNGSVHSQLSFRSLRSGSYWIAIEPFSTEVQGDYTLSILLPHSNPGAAWDHDKQEPNSGYKVAYPIEVGLDRAIRSSIEARDISIATESGDIDWYVFSARADEDYVVELFDVAVSIASRSGNASISDIGSYPGLAISIHNEQGTLLFRTRPDGNGNIHSRLGFTSGEEGGTILA